MRRHVQAVGNKRDRADQQTADDLDAHHHPAQADDDPGATFVLIVTRTEIDVIVTRGDGAAVIRTRYLR
jgi:hypothetical protein